MLCQFRKAVTINSFILIRGFIDEKIYDYPEDPDITIRRLENMSENEILSK